MRRWTWCVRSVITVVILGGVGWSAADGFRHLTPARVMARPRPASASAHTALPHGHTFLSLVAACGCGRHTELDAFSTTTGRRIRRLGRLRLPQAAHVSAPAVVGRRAVLITVSTGWRCDSHGEIYMECPRIIPDSCRNTVLRATPGVGEPHITFTIPGRVQVRDVAASPDGRALAFGQTPCTSQNGPSSLYIADAHAHHERLVFGHRNACDAVGLPAWSSLGRRLAVVYDSAPSAPTRGPAGDVRGCPVARNEILITSTAAPGHVKRIRDDPGCAYFAAAFDGPDILGVEGCRQGSRPSPVSIGDGDAFMVKLNPDGRRLHRWRLKRGIRSALITREPGTDRLIITQDLPANNNEPEADWVWELDDDQLRLINHYPAEDATEILAVGW